MKKEQKYIKAFILVIASALCLGLNNLPASTPGKNAAEAKDDLPYVRRVVDGDTLELSNAQKVRLIGIDTPEVYYSSKLTRDAERSHKDVLAIQALGKKASDFTKALCAGKRVRLEYDVERRDRYRRALAYVFLEDGTFVNARIMEEGYGQIMTIPPNVKYADLFLKLQNEAKKARKGLWKS
ncbi:MAG: thermonuclease family protein [Candidatus Omnitrophota bacterium]|nr:thermonuclease family protein [Candidatus Omnitrophota bacterium]